MDQKVSSADEGMLYGQSGDDKEAEVLCEAVVSSRRLCVDRRAALQGHRGDDSWNVKSILLSSWRSGSTFVLPVKKLFCTQGLIFFTYFVLNLVQFPSSGNEKAVCGQES